MTAFTQHCDVIGLQMHPTKDADPELGSPSGLPAAQMIESALHLQKLCPRCCRPLLHVIQPLLHHILSFFSCTVQQSREKGLKVQM